jgi:hypothetical protein
MPHIEGNDDGHGYGVRGTISRLNSSGVFGRIEIGFGMKARATATFRFIESNTDRKPISDICSVECHVQGRSSPETEQSIRDNTQR